MAVVSTPKGSRLQIVFITGKDAKGMDILRTRTYNGIKSASLDQDVLDVASALNGLQSNQVKSVSRINEVELTQG
ncbi:DUF1659 domain-containing protein [Aceticella autotrophica]|uniref:DUF1659 domain-containing protein n=1 Tax=Aceticella autotrophica TaxID=2755338 RepID=A0A975AWH5_9THEO|nr:DUF1659 domain-containing protein [Aceticella autotrophica]MDI6605408.1 DUF1659 domain-containing protein [Thermoanaerobacteraceae bacterium]QSZ27688.1 DUF1659 domain-containing protein [Aceticella autotrophica]